MNHGKGWGVVPWMLGMRSGERKYIENAEANSRHAMDVATGHVDDFEQAKHHGGEHTPTSRSTSDRRAFPPTSPTILSP